MKPKVAIGVTTYAPIFDATFGQALFDALAAASAKLKPYQVAISSAKFPINSAKDLGAHWLTLTPFALHDRKGGKLLEQGHFRQGAEWRTKGPLSGWGSVSFASDKDPHGSHQVVLEHNYSTKVDWVQLFRSVVDCFKPSHAMLHVFTERELSGVDKTQRFAFTGPIAGEAHFTAWLSSLGEWRKPDAFQLDERRRYRFISQLAWANVLGPEFAGRYDAGRLQREAACFEHGDGTAYVQVTDQLDDVLSAPDEFELARTQLKHAFSTDVFRS